MQDRMDVISLIRKHAARNPRQKAYCDGVAENSLTYAELIRRADAVAESLRNRGCRPGDRCGLLMPEGGEFLVSALGILIARLCVAPIGVFVPQAEIDFVIEAAQLHWFLLSDSKLVRFPLASPVDESDDKDFRACDPAYIRFTSGSTGRRKGVLLGHSTILERLVAANDLLKIGSHDNVWFNLPMADHFIVSTLLYLSRGATILSPKKSYLWPAAAQQATVVYGDPGFYRELIKSDISNLGSARLVISTTAPLPSQVAAEFLEKFAIPLNPALGMIELGLLTINFRRDKCDSVGIMMPAYKAAILNENNLVRIGQTGELQINGPGLLDAYLAPWRPKSKLLGTHGFPTGDYARFDAEGYLFLLGRGKNRITLGGVQFFCEEIESILNGLLGIDESRVYLDSGILSAELVGPLNSTDWIAESLETKLESIKIPTIFKIVSYLPRTPNGKISRIIE
jgi:long-chain acyl-CoA synthetase